MTAPSETVIAEPENPSCRKTLHRGLFAVKGEGFLPWQAYRPPETRGLYGAKAQKCGAVAGGKKRGTIILLNDYGAPFAAADLPFQLAARGFAAVSYSWYLQPGKAKNFSGKNNSGFRRYSCAFNRAALSDFLQEIVLPEYPAPFYLLAQGAGALFALSAHAVFNSAVSRIVAAAPVFSLRGHTAKGLYHALMKILAPFSRACYSSAAAAQASCAYRAQALDAAAAVLSPHSFKTMKLPCLLLIAGNESAANYTQTRRLAENLRLADSIILPAAAADFISGQTPASLHRPFWAAFDAFIPGNDANAANTALEHPALL